MIDLVAGAWRARADLLARWAWGAMVNRTDAWGRYTAVEQRGRPRRDGKGTVGCSFTAKGALTVEVLARHFHGFDPAHLIGLHSTGGGGTCRWGAFDIDRHDEATSPEHTLRTAYALYEVLREQYFTPLLTESNGQGGYHLRVLFAEPVPARDLHYLLGQVAGGVGYPGEQFPKQAALAAPGNPHL